MTAEVTPVVQAKGLVKRYGHVVAVDGADFELLPGEILAVIGDNGAGKSSLIKCLSGAVVPDEGEILLDGQPITMKTPIDARACSSSSGDVVTRCAVAFRMTQVMRVPGAASARAARFSRVLAAECPAPTTTT